MNTIFEKSCTGRLASSHLQLNNFKTNINSKFLRDDLINLPEVSELDVVRHYTKLSQQNFSVDTHFYPLGSCTMKYNPHILQYLAGIFSKQHPYAPNSQIQGFMKCMYELQEYLKEVTGFNQISLAPSAGAHGEFVGIAMIRAYHEARGDSARTEMIIPDSAHGTNPASAAMCNYKICEIHTSSEGDIDLDHLKKSVGSQTAGIMLTNPSTLGVFERNIVEISKIIHDAGGLLYCDGANLNAILGKVRPKDMGFDVMHMNLHKTFGTPHGGGGPGSGPVAANENLAPFLPVPIIKKTEDKYTWVTYLDCKQTIGKISAFYGNSGVLIRAYAYIRLLGKDGLKRVSEYATLNSNYLKSKLQQLGFTVSYKNRRASHEFIVTLKDEAKAYNITAKDFGKRLLDYGFHAPTTYFPLIVPECFLIEPTETESKQEIDKFAEIMAKILQEAKTAADLLKNAPHNMPIKRLDEVKAVKDMDFAWKKAG